MESDGEARNGGTGGEFLVQSVPLDCVEELHSSL